MKMPLAEQIHAVLSECFYTQEEVKLLNNEVPEDAVKVRGIVNNFGFHPARLEKNREQVKAILDQMDPMFKSSEGGGCSFLALCVDKHGENWGEHTDMECLMCLGMGLGMVGYCAPREFWSKMPGEMPYIWIDTNE